MKNLFSILKSYSLNFSQIFLFVVPFAINLPANILAIQTNNSNHDQSKVCHKAESTSSNSVFDKHKPDITNPHLDDIQYNLIKKNNSFLAVGKIVKLYLKNIKPKEDKSIGKEIITPKCNKTEAKKEDLESLLQNNIYENQEIDKLLLSLESENNEPNEELEFIKSRKIETNSIIMQEVKINDFQDWIEENFDHALEAFTYSCNVIKKYPPHKQIIRSKELIFGKWIDWVEVCLIAEEVQKKQLDSRQFFEENFSPFLIFDKIKKSSTGIFTGYHEFSIMGNVFSDSKYQYPLYRKPKNCTNSSNCPTRTDINNGHLEGLGLELCWVNSPFDLWKMQMQGSGIIILPNGDFLRLSFGGTNQHAAKNIWDYIKKNLPPSQFKYSSIRTLLSTNNQFAMSVNNYNPSYTFFAANNSSFAKGGHWSYLVPGRSMAIDLKYLPYGLPMWIQTKLPVKEENNVNSSWINFNRILITQDTGSAIKGPVRADIFFGHGDKATYLANHMKFKGSYYALIPNKVVPHIKHREN